MKGMANPLYGISVTSFYSARNARIASAVLATAIPSVRPSICLSVCPSVTRWYCVKTTARSTVQFAPLDVLSFTLLCNYTIDNMLRNVCQLIQHTDYLITVCVSMCFLGDRL